MSAAHDGWKSFRDLDVAAGLPKGSAFRAFKQIEATLVDGQDYQLLRFDHDWDEIEKLKDGGRVYAGSVNVVLLSPQAAARVAAALPR